MAKKFYLVPKSGSREAEIGSYEVEGSLTDFPRGVYLAYADKGLVTGLDSFEEAVRWRDEGEYDKNTDAWVKVPERKPIA